MTSEGPTTPDPVALTRRMMDALNRRDIDAYMRFYATDAVFDLSDVGIGTFEGVAAISGFFDDWHASWEHYLLEVDEMLDLGHGVVFTAYREQGRLVGSEGLLEQRRGRIALWAGGRIERVTNYLDIEEARAAAERLAAERAEALPRENREIVRAAFRAFEKGDMEEVLRLCDERVEITQAVELPGVSPRQFGHAGVLEAFALWPEQWDDFHVEILRLAEIGGHIMVRALNRGRGRDSGVQVEMPFTFLFALRAGKITEWRIFMSEEQALEALGEAE